VRVLFRRAHPSQSSEPLVADVRRCLVRLQLDGHDLRFDLSRCETDRDHAGERLATEIAAEDIRWVAAGRDYFDQHGVAVAAIRRT
jgi:hypothetical protein